MRPADHASTPAADPAGVEASSSRARAGRATWVALALLAGTWLTLLLVRTYALDWFAVPTGSMEPALRPGETILVDKRPQEVRRGDLVVVAGDGLGLTDDRPLPRRLLGLVVGESPGAHLVKRVVGVGGERVACCDPAGRVTVDGRPLTEPYVHPADTPSDVTFDVRLPAGTLWLMGDHRSRSADSRARLGSPGGGVVPLRDVTGTVVRVVWPPHARRDPSTTHPSTGGDR